MIRLPYPKAIIFDWDNTLVNTWPAITVALNKARSAYGLETWTVEEARVKSARALRVSFPEWFGDDWKDARDIFYDCYHKEHATRLVEMDGAESLLSAVQDANIPAVIVSTKKNTILNTEVDHMGWRPYFKAIVGSIDASHDKPHPAPVVMALREVGLKIGDEPIWFVGDTHADVECALRCSCMPVLVNNLSESICLGIKWSFSDCNEVKKTFISSLTLSPEFKGHNSG